MGERVGNWMVTASGRAFHPIDPRADEVTIEDIAHALARLCRFGGHCTSFYSVAQHCVLVSEGVEDACREKAIEGGTTLAIWGLFHDAAEAYCGDVIWPLKQEPALRAAFAPIEARIMVAICERFGLAIEEPGVVKHSDLRALATEKRDLTARAPNGASNTPLEAAAAKARTGAWHSDHVEPYPFTIEPWSPEYAEWQFIRRFDELRTRRAREGVPGV